MTKVSAADCADSRRGLKSAAISYCGIRLSTRTGPFKAQFPTPIRPTRMIVWLAEGGLAEGALLSAVVDEVDMGFSCLLKPISVVFVSPIIRLFSIGPFGICEKWTLWKPSACVASTAFTKLGVSQALMDVRSTTS